MQIDLVGESFLEKCTTEPSRFWPMTSLKRATSALASIVRGLETTADDWFKGQLR